jgi:hypothetical protein
LWWSSARYWFFFRICLQWWSEPKHLVSATFVLCRCDWEKAVNERYLTWPCKLEHTKKYFGEWTWFLWWFDSFCCLHCSLLLNIFLIYLS